MRRFIGAAIVALCIVAVGSGSASAQTKKEKWIVTTKPGQPTRVVASGLVNAKGTVTDHLKLNPNGTFDNRAEQVFPKGQLFYHGAGTYKIKVNPKTCTGTGDVVGPFKITGGSGAYKGASGKGVALIKLRFVFGKTSTGCSQRPVKTFGVANANGTLTLP
jgi:hypothetical protein